MGNQTCSFEPESLEGTAMRNRGTADEVSPGQFATISSRITLALPEALKFSGLDTKSIIKFTDEGERLSHALAEAFNVLYNGNAVTVPHRFRELNIDRSTPVESSISWPVYRKYDCSLQVRSVTPARIKLYPCWQTEQVPLTGDQIRDRITANKGFIPLDVVVMRKLLSNPLGIPREWGERSQHGTYRIFFDGVTVYSAHGSEHTYFMRYHPSRNAWEPDDYPLENFRVEGDYTAVLEA